MLAGGLTSLNLSCGTMLDKNQLQGAARPWRQLLVLAVLTGPSLLCYSVNVQVLSTAAMVPGLQGTELSYSCESRLC